jgi:hypothetical protein
MQFQNNTNYPLSSNQRLADIGAEYDKEKEYLTYHQYIVKEFMIKSDSRGLLIYHSPGTGKTAIAAAIADYYRKHDKYRRIIVMLPKSLENNFRQTVSSYMKKNPDNDDAEKGRNFIENTLQRYTFVSLNASNMYAQVKNIGANKKAEIFNKMLGKFNKELKIDSQKHNMLENSLLIIDEFHNFNNSIKNQSKNAVQLYRAIMNTKNIKLVFLTGTPIINAPFEVAPMFNLLKGHIGKSSTLFPENSEEFDRFFVEKVPDGGLKIKNKPKFQNRIFGMVSYFGDFYFDKKDKEGFPEERPIIIEKAFMSDVQFNRYKDARTIERKEESSKFKKSGEKSHKFEVGDKSKSSSSYRIRSRQTSNYCIPDYARTLKHNGLKSIKHIDKIKREDLERVDVYSPKFAKVFENIDKHANQLGLVYSEFVSGEGIAIFAKILNVRGYTRWLPGKSNKARVKPISEDAAIIDIDGDLDAFDEAIGDEAIGDEAIGDEVVGDEAIGADGPAVESFNTTEETRYATEDRPEKKSVKVYAIISGDISIMDRREILKKFNAPKNRYGGVISLLMISKSGAEGLSFKNIRHLHIMEPFWNYARIEQIIARGTRFNSHSSLEPAEQNMQPYIYLSVYPKKYKGKDLEGERPTDEELWLSALTNKKVIDDFMVAMIESSIDCSAHYGSLKDDIKKKYSCRVCAPNNDVLYDANIHRDVQVPDTCKKMSTGVSIDVKEIKVLVGDHEDTFYYKQDPVNKINIKLFTFDPTIKGYIPMNKNYPHYSEIISKILFPNGHHEIPI